ncbi:MAG: M1 family aminopeptidase [Terracidiphilus sp.]
MNCLRRIALIFSLAIPLIVAAQDKPNPLSYNLQVNLEPEAGSIAVQGDVEIPLERVGATTLKFNLHETFAISKLLVDGRDATFTYAPMEGSAPLPASRAVVVNLPPGIPRGDIRMDIAYGGHLEILPEFGASPDMRRSLDDQINSRMVELAVYSTWYPEFVFGSPIKSELTLSLPHDWIPVCSGRKLDDRIDSGRAITRWSSPKDVDIVILASPNYKLKSIRKPDITLDTYSTQMPEPFIAKEGKQISGVLKLYSTLYGPTNIPNGIVKHVYSPKRKGQALAGFARPGLIVTSEGRTLESLAQDPGFSLFQGIAHEVGHYWWNFGSGQGDWINEAFAEYSSAVAVEKLSSEASFRDIMASDRMQVAALPSDASSLATIGISEQTSFVVRYYKGSLLLDTLRHAMGDDKFFGACREFFETYNGKPTGTAEFRSFWKSKLLGNQKLVDAWLDAPGGLPGAK